MEDGELHEKLEELTDLEIAILLSLVAKQHCIIDTEEDAIDDLEKELRLVCATSESSGKELTD